MEKSTLLLKNGWTPIADSWKPPVTFGRPLYFDLETAYELETVGVGVWAYAAEQLLLEARKAQDVEDINDREAARFAATGIPLGVYPNY